MAYLIHYGTPRHSGRYPWGTSGWGEGPPYDRSPEQRTTSFLGQIKKLRAEGLTDKEIYEGMGMNSSQFRNRISIENAALRAENRAKAIKLKEKGYSNSAIAKKIGLPNESSVRSLLDDSLHEKSQIIFNIAGVLEDHIRTKGMIDVGFGVERNLGVADTKLKAAITHLVDDKGYALETIKQEQMGMPGKYSTVKVLASPDIVKQAEEAGLSTRNYISNNREKIKMISDYSEDGGRSFLGVEPVRSVSSKKIQVRYAEEGGADMDGIIELRRGVDELSLGRARYAQVRIAVDDTHYLKGMAIYSDTLPDGVDIRFNTNKKQGTPMIGPKDNTVLKPMETTPEGTIDQDNPFGTTIRQRHYVDSKGNTQLSSINVVGARRFDEDGNEVELGHGEEGAWGEWSKTLSSQMLSKQSTDLADQQLTKAYNETKEEYDRIMSLTNPVVKQVLLEKFADGADSSAVHLKAAGLPNQAHHVILPLPNIKETEVYAPNYENGTKLALIRHPHGGIFEIPELTVNNKTPAAKALLGNEPDRHLEDALGIHPNVAAQLSGADFDGDTVIAIPNTSKGPSHIKTSPAIQSLIDFDPKAEYPSYPGMKVIDKKYQQRLMGEVSNLITDMTIKQAPEDEIVRAVKHSMVVIDAYKHKLDYRRSKDNFAINDLAKRYQSKGDGTSGGASTLISRAKSEERIPMRNPYIVDEHGKRQYIDEEGRKLYSSSGKTTVRKEVDKKTGEVRWVEKERLERVTKMALTPDAMTLSSGSEMEAIYANYANNMKSLANSARRAAADITTIPQSASAKKAYSVEVASLKAKLNDALKNKERERNAQLLAGNELKVRRQANPGMEASDIKKIRNQALAEARVRTGAKRQQVDITPPEWEAIQAGAVAKQTLIQILNNTDMDQIRKYATPRETSSLTDVQLARARRLMANGATQEEAAQALGVPRSTLMDNLRP